MESRDKNQKKTKKTVGKLPGRKAKKTPLTTSEFISGDISIGIGNTIEKKLADEQLYCQAVAHHIKDLREARALTGENLAELSYFMDSSHVYKLENNKMTPSLETLYRIATALGIPVWELLMVDTPPAIQLTPAIEKAILYMSRLEPLQQEYVLQILQSIYRLNDSAHPQHEPEE